MPSRIIFPAVQRGAIFDPSLIARLYTLGPNDLGQVVRRRCGVWISALIGSLRRGADSRKGSQTVRKLCGTLPT